MKRLAAVLAVLLLGLSVAHADDFSQTGAYDFTGHGFKLGGFVEQQYTTANNQAYTTTNCYGDSKGVLGYPGCGASTSYAAQQNSSLNLFQLTGGYEHEFDSGLKVDTVLTARLRNGDNDIIGQPWYEKNVGVYYPGYGTLRAGTQLARAWSRQDSFSYPLGLSSAWSETGAGFSVLPQSVRYTTDTMEVFDGKLTLELTYATNNPFNSYYSSLPAQSPTPTLWEYFAQYSDESNLVELILETSSGAAQSSWGKNPLVGAANLPVITTPSNVYGNTPNQSVFVLEGNHYFNPQWMLTWGVRRSYWSGAALICDYAAQFNGCVYQGGFNISTATTAGNQTYNPGWAATENDAMLGLSYYNGLWTYTAGAVYLGAANTQNPIDNGQSNSALLMNFGTYRKMPELMRNLSLYGGLGLDYFAHLGPAPLSMPSNTAITGADSRMSTQTYSVTVGALLRF